LLMIEKAAFQSSLSITNRFNNSQIKKRISMINKQPSSPWAKIKFLYLIPIMLFVICIFSPISASIPQEGSELSPEMQATLNHIARYIKYPTDAFEKGIQGKVVLELHLRENEHQNTVKVIESVSPSLDAEAVRIIKDSPIWKTSHKGIFRYIISIHFNLK